MNPAANPPPEPHIMGLGNILPYPDDVVDGLIAHWRSLPIELVEPDAPAPQGDRVPCHLFMPEVGWPEALPPVLRTPRRELYLQSVNPWGPEPIPTSPPYQWFKPCPGYDDLDAEVDKALRAGLAGLVFCLLALLVLWGLSEYPGVFRAVAAFVGGKP